MCLIFVFFMNGNTERAQCTLSHKSASLKKKKRKAVKRLNKFIKYLKRVKKNHDIWSLRW